MVSKIVNQFRALAKQATRDLAKIGVYKDPSARVSGNLVIGAGSVILDRASLRTYGTGKITIGEGCCIGVKAQINAADGVEIVLGRHVTLQMGAFVEGPSQLGDGCVVGTKVHVLGSRVGDKSVISHHSVVDGEDIGERQLWAGDPAEYIRHATDDEIQTQIEMAEDVRENYLQELETGAEEDGKEGVGQDGSKGGDTSKRQEG